MPKKSEPMFAISHEKSLNHSCRSIIRVGRGGVGGKKNCPGPAERWHPDN